MNRFDTIMKARRAESENNWQLAADEWKKAGRTDDMNACLLIVEACRKGDAYREDIKSLDDEMSQGDMTPNEYHEKLRLIYRKHYK